MTQRQFYPAFSRVLRAVAIALSAAGALSAVGCARYNHKIPDSAPPQPNDLFQPFNEQQALPQSLVEMPPYRLNVADVIEIIYQVKVGAKTGDRRGYRLQSEDVIEIKFPYHRDLDQRHVVLPDGYINCMLIGRVRAVGETLDALQAQLTNAYKRYVKNVEPTVIVKEANKKIDELKKAITTAPRGQSRLMPVKPDGTIDLPYIGNVYAFGRTIPELRATLNQEYVRNDLEEIEVTVQCLEFAPRRVYVMGEVNQVGVFPTQQNVTVIQALTMAGGMNTRADKSHVMVVRRKFLPIPQATIVDVQSLLDGRKPSPEGLVPNGERMRYDFFLQDEDVVYVPPTDLALAGDFTEMFFNRIVRPIFPVSGILGMNFGYQIYNAPSTYTNNVKGPPRFNTTIGP